MSFTSDIRSASKILNESMEDTSRNVIQALFKGVIQSTPADTGRLRGNWGVGVNNSNTGNRNRTGASGAIGEVKSKVTGRPAKYWLVNNLPYAVVAEYGKWGTGSGATEKTTRDGYSVQAPKGMVRVNVVRIMRNIKNLIRKGAV